jgi:hypothetical protein
VVLIDFLCANTNIFVWEDAEHSLDILPHSKACSSTYNALTKKGVGRSEWSYASSSRPGKSRKCFTHVVS